MTRKRSWDADEPGLFDLPLDPPAAGAEAPTPAAAAPPRRSAPPTPARPPVPPPRPFAGDPGPVPEPIQRPDRDLPVALSARLLAGLADLAVHLALGLILLFGARLLGVPAGLAEAPALVAFLLVFSFLYTVIPLAFWGQTPGMAWAGVVARTPTGESLTFGQTARRWVGGVVTFLLLGLPTLLAAGGGRSLADRLSDSRLRPS